MGVDPRSGSGTGGLRSHSISSLGVAGVGDWRLGASRIPTPCSSPAPAHPPPPRLSEPWQWIPRGDLVAGSWGIAGDRVPSLERLGSGHPCGLEARRWALGSGGARRGRARGEWILRAAGVVESSARGPSGAGAPDLLSPPGLRSPPRAFPGLMRPDGIKVRYPPPPPFPGRLGGPSSPWRRRSGLQAGPSGGEVAR